ncbi:MAG: DUF433 domain-containing protein [Polyangiaceae bacterium]
MAREPKLDRRDLPRYTPQEAAHHLSLPVSTVRAWSVGQRGRQHDKVRFFQPLIAPAQKAPLSLSFWNLVELYVLRSLRRTHDFPMPKVRAALRFTGEKLGARRPLIEETFYSDGVKLLVERLASLIDTSDGQTVMRGVLVDSLRRVERGTDGRVVRFYPWLNEPNEVRAVEIDPDRAFGRLVLVGTGIPTQAIAERFAEGDDIDVLARDFELDVAKVQQALRWEQRTARAA